MQGSGVPKAVQRSQEERLLGAEQSGSPCQGAPARGAGEGLTSLAPSWEVGSHHI